MTAPYSSLLSWLGCLSVLLVTACAAPTRTEVSFEPGLQSMQASHEAVVLFPTYREAGSEVTFRTILDYQLQSRYDTVEIGFIGCLKKQLEKNVSPQVKLVDAAAFQNALFPWFEPQHTPLTIKELETLLERPLVRERIAALGVRYLVNIASSAEADGFPGMLCGAGYGGGGCLGLSWENKMQRVQAVIWDIVHGGQAGALTTTTTGRSVAVGMGVPIMFVANTRQDACKALAAELGHLLVDTTRAATTGK